MREIKFRAFDNLNKKMHLVISIWGFPEVEHITVPDGETVDPLFNNFELMQFIGVTDKNGVEIYEGDVMNYGIVVFKNGCFGIIDSNNYFICFNDVNLCFYKVIGNIHENPELL